MYLDDGHADTASKDLIWTSQQYVSPLASTSKDQISNNCADNIDSQIISKSSSTERSLFLLRQTISLTIT